jgi:hypothetical protein
LKFYLQAHEPSTVKADQTEIYKQMQSDHTYANPSNSILHINVRYKVIETHESIQNHHNHHFIEHFQAILFNASFVWLDKSDNIYLSDNEKYHNVDLHYKNFTENHRNWDQYSSHVVKNYHNDHATTSFQI